MGKEVAGNGNTPEDKDKQDATEPVPPLQLLQSCLSILEKAVNVKDVRLITGRLLRQTAAARQRLTADIVTTFANSALPDGAPLRGKIVASLSQVKTLIRFSELSVQLLMNILRPENSMQAGQEMDTDGAQDAPAVSITACSLPEAEVYAGLLAITYLIDKKQYQEVSHT